MSFSQGEADTIMLSAYAALRSSGYGDPVVIDAEDTDVYIQAAAISHHIPASSALERKGSVFSAGACVLKILPIAIYPFMS